MLIDLLKSHDLAALLCRAEDYRPYPRRGERERWAAIPQEKKQEILDWGREAQQGYPMLTATQYMAFRRTGERTCMETPYFQRRRMLIGAVLAECVADDGSFLDAVIDGLWCVCEETSWCISAHNRSDEPGAGLLYILPDADDPVIDLFAAQTAATLAQVLYLLEDKLVRVSPLIPLRVRREVDRRIITPFLNRDDYWWMGKTRADLNNWTPWIVSNVLDTLLLAESAQHRRVQGVARSMRMLDAYLRTLPADGGCDEGAGYFNMAGASLGDALESLYAATTGKISIYGEEHVRQVMAFPLKAHISGDNYLNFADCDAKPILDGERLYTLGMRTENHGLMALGAAVWKARKGVRPPDTPQMNRVLFSLFADIPDMPQPPAPAFMAMPDLQVFAWRRGSLYLAAKGGHNLESHNHNDVGQFILYKDGEPVVLDPGNCVYTAKTFSRERYTLMNTRAMNHNVPLIGGIEQEEGRERAASSVQADETGLAMDIAAAYPERVGVRRLRRAWQVAAGVDLTDEIDLTEPKSVAWVFMLRYEPRLGEGSIDLGGVTLTHDKALTAAVEEIPVTDRRMARNFPGSLWRLTLTAAPAREHRQRFSFA